VAVSGLGVAIVAGGEGRRLRPLIGDLPKALAPFAGGTLLGHQLRRVEPLGAAQVVVLAGVGPRAARLDAAAGGRAALLSEPAPLGTAGCLGLLPEGPDRWLVLNVDHISDVDLAAFCDRARAPATALVWRAPVPIDEGVVELQDTPDGPLLSAWKERPVLRLPVTTGLYLFTAAALAPLRALRPLDMPRLVEGLMPQGVLAIEHPGFWVDAGTPERLARAEALWGSAGGGR
jgi:NDP-sugar pyrophosphorylase family protein